ncbi:hypothetical protein AMELA_G00293150 [Ameiurus melas]|uniref:Kinesin motor domain-containing protein n=1 Tax=Ameiurus melas TaxID=219545 RepID=A0A7J5ZK56_AMEME|nr:hypothetical protein AMELA_G00293150 [Ameiurus melas]
MNSTSSRSHAIFAMTLESKETREEEVTIRTSRLSLVDLAGTEKQSDTQTEGSRLKVIKSLAYNMKIKPAYRDSKLTLLLRVKPLVVHGPNILNLQEEDEDMNVDMLKYTQKDLDTALEMTQNRRRRERRLCTLREWRLGTLAEHKHKEKQEKQQLAKMGAEVSALQVQREQLKVEKNFEQKVVH